MSIRLGTGAIPLDHLRQRFAQLSTSVRRIVGDFLGLLGVSGSHGIISAPGAADDGLVFLMDGAQLIDVKW